MYLKRLELFGFKSFAEKSELNLSKGISAIIGPNGCGKSNLVDAVRWALGEQSVKSLRGLHMEEVIFSGSDNRKPLNFAEVSLTFSGTRDYLNIEYDEVTITRRLFRNGDSEYYINKTPCRLKDITELFLDTGLGKEVYSVIGQGRVAEIVGSRPEERREIFEEAAGILKYKLRKKEAGRRLDETKDNLVRIEDLVYELSTQIEPLKAQAEITRQYKKLKQQVEDEEKNLLSFELYQTGSRLNKVNRQIERLTGYLFSAAAQRGAKEKAFSDLKNEFSASLALRKEEEQNLNQLVRRFEQEENELKILKERANSLSDLLSQQQNRIAHLDIELADYVRRTALTEEALLVKDKEYRGIEEELQKLRAKLETFTQSAAAHTIEHLQEDIYKTEARTEALLTATAELTRRLKGLKEQLLRSEEAEKELYAQLQSLTLKAEELHQLAVKKQNHLVQGEEQLKQSQSRVVNLKNKLLEANAAEQKIKEQLNEATGRLNLLKEQNAALTGYYRGVKEVVQAGSELSGIIGPVADLIKVESTYVRAIEAALGTSMQYLVAEKEKDAQRAIGYLKQKNKGWATFLPLDILHLTAAPLKRYPGWQDLPGVVGQASELVQIEAPYRRASDYLLAAVVICRTLEDAAKLARFTSYSLKIVTLDGDTISPGGVMRGGSLPERNAGMPLGRRKEIEELEQKKAKLEKLCREAVEVAASINNELAECRQNSAQLALTNSRFQEELSALKAKAERLSLEKETTEAMLAGKKQEYSLLLSEESEALAKQQSNRKEIDEGKNSAHILKEKLAVLKTNHHQFLEDKAALEQMITDTLVQKSSCYEQQEALKLKIEELKDSLKKPLAEKAATEITINNNKQALADNGEKQFKLTEELELLNEKRAAAVAILEGITTKASQNEAALIEMEEEDRRRQVQQTRYEKRERQLSVEQTRLETEANYQKMRYKELFNSPASDYCADDYNPETGRLKIENLKEDLDGLGEVNLGAIDELARLEERIGFLEEQKEDLLKGETALNKVLLEIDQRMTYYFSKALERINENFNDTFRSLFQGGSVSLKLTDESNILEAGIEIIAQPPGKKLQNITLFSGGEKVLIAIALVFAIMRFKPAPFYLLDEVESMLDNANLLRFTGFLKENAKDAQFILITHRKRTMEEAEVLYGVTMPEPGVSRLMSIRPEEHLAGQER